MITEPSSFRDPSGHLYWHEGNIYRTITDKYIKINYWNTSPWNCPSSIEFICDKHNMEMLKHI